MTVLSHTLGFPRIGIKRELKIAQENYWAGRINKQALFDTGSMLRQRHWKQQKDMGINLIPVGDFAWYDHVLTTSMMLGNVPKRCRNNQGINDIDTLFHISRGYSFMNKSIHASKMIKWFNTNYHYIVPEFTCNQQFKFDWTQLLDEVDEALKLNYKIKPILLGPISYLWLGKAQDNNLDRLSLLPLIIPVYQTILYKLAKRGILWIQIDEPILALELPKKWCLCYIDTYQQFKKINIQILLTTYFDSIYHHIDIIKTLPVHGLHVDLVAGHDNLVTLHNILPKNWVISAGIINGRNIWRTDIEKYFNLLHPLISVRKIWVGSSCSLLHCPIDLDFEIKIDTKTKSWFAFAIQKCHELNLLCTTLNNASTKNKMLISKYSEVIRTYKNNNTIHNAKIQKRLKQINATESKRKQPYAIRVKLQKKSLNLPLWPTTTIGSFPQTNAIRKLRLDFKNGILSFDQYQKNINHYIHQTIKEQEKLNLDVLVHGEIERNDMVEYFSEYLNGFISTQNGWVQSYGSRYVKPPIIISDIIRPKGITVKWVSYAQSLTCKPVKGMLTGPITILCWSFLREDISNEIIAKQLALALRDEVKDLEDAGINIIQIDEPAIREGLPLKRSAWPTYLNWAIESFRLSTSLVKDTTQIHTHMCYGEFNDIIDYIKDMDVDVITIEASRSNMKMLEIFKKVNFSHAIGPGIYDVHSPNIPSVSEIMQLLHKASKYIKPECLWVNPDCGLKTRTWIETRKSLANMVAAAKKMRINRFINKI